MLTFYLLRAKYDGGGQHKGSVLLSENMDVLICYLQGPFVVGLNIKTGLYVVLMSRKLMHRGTCGICLTYIWVSLISWTRGEIAYAVHFCILNTSKDLYVCSL